LRNQVSALRNQVSAMDITLRNTGIFFPILRGIPLYGKMSPTCDICQRTFKFTRDLERHLRRKTSCAPIIEEAPASDGLGCQYCGRAFASRRTLTAHIRNRCKIAGSEEGMELLFEHTLKKQEEALELRAAAAKIAALEAEVRELKRPTSQGSVNNSGQIGQVNVDNSVGQVNNNTYNVITFTEAPTSLTCEKILDALRSCPNFSQYARMGDPERFDKDNRSIVHGSIMDLTKLSHEDPLARNVYLSPNRADQAMILASKDVDTKKWEILPLDDALKQIIGSMSRQLRDVGHDHRIQIDIDDRGALCGLGFITQVEDASLAQELRKPMTAHLENQRYVGSAPARRPGGAPGRAQSGRRAAARETAKKRTARHLARNGEEGA
jgi:hypothetical protein